MKRDGKAGYQQHQVYGPVRAIAQFLERYEEGLPVDTISESDVDEVFRAS